MHHLRPRTGQDRQTKQKGGLFGQNKRVGGYFNAKLEATIEFIRFQQACVVQLETRKGKLETCKRQAGAHKCHNTEVQLSSKLVGQWDYLQPSFSQQTVLRQSHPKSADPSPRCLLL